jgi:23S rRNA (cytosine1962-C5)-methyltransferase
MLCERIKMKNPNILAVCPDDNYSLLDSGEGEKLEKYGQYILSRPDPQALWRKRLPEKEWEKAHAIFLRDGRSTEWKIKLGVPTKWVVELQGLKFWVKPTSFKHTGLFPEQSSNWHWLSGVIHSAKRPLEVLNLFGYTGASTLATAKAGAKVCHVDSSKSAITWARENAELNGMQDKPIRWIMDDAVKFVKREIKRDHRYDGIIMDPPAFGHGPTGEMWKIEDNFLDLLDLCKQLLSDNPAFFLVNGYSSGYSAIAYENALGDLMSTKGEIEKGALTIREQATDRILPCGIFARWLSK